MKSMLSRVMDTLNRKNIMLIAGMFCCVVFACITVFCALA